MTTSPLTAPVPVVPAAALRIEDMPAATRATLLEVLIHGSLPRAELARRLGLSRASLTRIARTLVEAGLLAEGETRLRAATGRPSEMLRVRSSARRFLGVKLTGDTLYAVVADLGAEVTASTEHALRSSDVAEVVRQIAEAAHELAGDGAPLASIGIAIAGRVRQSAGGAVVEHSAFLDWHHVELARLVREATGLACSVENDVQALTAAEHWFGAGAGLESMALVTVGTGIGCGWS
ncbi:ROK family transcriptional regulator [Rathayibacter sp. VKM Ac-2630]|uniref:ROK family transcriptional regulator n=1 Tax=Rathayibacter sp. VKM Ac-2630 TaxID=1938617 RepID=UPI00191BE751|nr:ROK family transcriptional regulator [Rathayibacter sp. VKM Ac-2630]